MSYAPYGWQHGNGFETIDLSDLLCCFCNEWLGVIHQYQLSGLEIHKCGEFNYSCMAHSWCAAFKEEFDAWNEEHGYDWRYEERYMTPERLAYHRKVMAERELEYA